MPSPVVLSVRRLDVYRLAIELVADLASVAAVLGRAGRDLASQLRRAASSVPLNLSEGMRRTGRDRGHLLGVALGSPAPSALPSRGRSSMSAGPSA